MTTPRPRIPKKLAIRSMLARAGIDTHSMTRALRKALDSNVFQESDLLLDFFRAAGIRRGVMLDVGAHYGESLMPYLARGWTIYAFEPDPDPGKSAALALLKSRRLRVFDKAVTDKSGETLLFYASVESSGISGLSAFRDSHRAITSVTTIALHDFLAEFAIAEVDFLKIDTEGYDLFVLKGYPWGDAQLRPKGILCEFEDSKTTPLGYDHRDLGNYLLAKDYVVYLSEWFPIVRYGIRHRWRSIARFPVELHAPDAWGNLIAIDARLAVHFATEF